MAVNPHLRILYRVPSQVHVAAANTVHWDLWNGTVAQILRVTSVVQVPDIIAVTGVLFAWSLARTTAIGTAGSALTAVKQDMGQEDIDALITCRSKPTGGATEGVILRDYAINSEEATAATITAQLAMASGGQIGVELLPKAWQPPFVPEHEAGVLIRPGAGLRCNQITNSNAGNTGWIIAISVHK